jgi:hypothetical protein
MRTSPASSARSRADDPLVLTLARGHYCPKEHQQHLELAGIVRPYRAGEYPNFVEEPADASGFFEAAVWDRLRDVKRRYDPADLFAGNHHVPPATAADH